MPFNSDFPSRQLDYVNIETGFTEAEYRIGASIMLPFGLFLVFQAYQRMKITHILMSVFFMYAVFGSSISSGTDIITLGIGMAKVLGGGALLAVGCIYWEWIGFTILGMFTGLFPAVVFLQQFADGSTIKDQQTFINGHQTVLGFLVLGGMIIPCILQKKIVIPFSVVLGVSMLTLSGSIFLLGGKYYSTMNQYKWSFVIFQIAIATLGFVVQYYFKNKEEKVQEELIRQKNEEIAKNAEAINSYYQNANATQNQRGVPVPVYGQPMPIPMSMQRSVYQAPPVYSQMNVSGGQQSFAGNPVSPPPKNENIPVHEIKANLANIHIKSNKQYDF